MPRKARKPEPISLVPAEVLRQLPDNQLLLYSLLWEFETWLREMVYVELVSRYGSEWTSKIVGDGEKAHKRDSRLRHMPTREKRSTSYMVFSQLRRTISRRWVLFREYLPPKDIWDARLNEVEQIRNRVAHFRRGHPDDLKRVQQLLRDIDQGFWRFCTSYNDAGPIVARKVDAIAREFAELDPFPWTEVEPNTLVRIGHAPPDLLMAVTVELLRRPWLKARPTSSVAGRYGYLYDVHLVARGGRVFDYEQFLKNTKRLHARLCHICLDASEVSIRMTVPCVSGVELILPDLKELVEWGRRSLQPGPRRVISPILAPILGLSPADKLAMEWPEYVIGPGNPLAFLGPGMKCEFFQTS